MAAVSAPAGEVSPCTDAAIDSIPFLSPPLPVLTYFLADDDLYVAVEPSKPSRFAAATVRPSAAL